MSRGVRRPRTGGRTSLAIRVLGILIGLEFVAGVAAAAYLTGNAAAPSGRPASAGGSTVPGQSTRGRVDPAVRSRAVAVRALLQRHGDAVLRHDRGTFLADLDPQGPAFRLRQARLFDALRPVPLAEWAYVLDPAREQAGAASRLIRYRAPVWVPDVTARYRLAGFDDEPILQRQYLTFVERSGRWYLASDSDYDRAGDRTERGLWDFGAVVVVRTAHTLVLGHPGSSAVLRTIARVCEAAIPRVAAIWRTGWSGRVVVLVPASTVELARLTEDSGDLSHIAAVATAELAGRARPSGERILVNPPNYTKLAAVGRRVVLQHEITHVATRQATSPSTPQWLAEGFADYVGFQGSGLSVRVAAHELAVDVGRGRLPTRLPTNGDFAGSSPALAQTYEMSWLACRLIAERVGQAGLVRFYAEVGRSQAGSDRAVALALGSVLHLDSAQFTSLWRSYLRVQLR